MESEAGSKRWREVNAGSGVADQAAGRVEEVARATPEEISAAQDALVGVAAAGRRLAKALDGLASQYERPHANRSSEVHIALDQAAAAAEDLANSTRVAAQALADEA